MSNILTDNNKILKARNLWLQFDTVAASYLQFGTTSTLRFINDTGIFRIEFDYVPADKASQYIIYTGASLGFDITGTSTTIIFRTYNSIGGWGWNLSGSVKIGQQHHIIIYGNGVNLYININGVITTQAYTGSFNVGTTTTQPRFGTHTANYCSGKLRNVKIYNTSDTSGLLHWFTLQDANNIGTAIVGGVNATVTGNISIVDNIDTTNWASITTSPVSQAFIGSTSTFGWMNSGIFNMEFEMTHLALPTANHRLFYTATTVASHRGFMFLRTAGNTVGFYWMNGSGGYAYSLASTGALVFGVPYKYIVKGDGTNIQVMRTLLDGTIQFDSDLVPCTYVPAATTSAFLVFKSSTYNYDALVRNFKIYTDFAGTVPFMDLPMQNAENLMTDRITGLQGSVNRVSIINTNTNVLRSKNLWCSFGDDGVGMGNINLGDSTSFNWLHQTGVFRIKFYFKYISAPTGMFFTTRIASANNGIYIYNSVATERLYVAFGSGGLNICSGYWNVFTAPADYKIILVGNGTGIRLYVGVNGSTPTDYGIINYTGVIVPTGNAGLSYGTIGGYGANFLMQVNKLRNFEFYSSSDESVPVYKYPLTDGGNIAGDIMGNLQGSFSGTVKVVEI